MRKVSDIMIKILFLHGKESEPGGEKVSRLERDGYTIFNPFLTKHSFEKSVATAQDIVDTQAPDIIVGSSRGGAIAMCLETHARLILIAPAWSHYRQTAGKKLASDTMILHSRDDTIIRFEDSKRLAEIYNVTLIETGVDHRMRDEQALETLSKTVEGCISENPGLL